MYSAQSPSFLFGWFWLSTRFVDCYRIVWRHFLVFSRCDYVGVFNQDVL